MWPLATGSFALEEAAKVVSDAEAPFNAVVLVASGAMVNEAVVRRSVYRMEWNQ